jgi:outer membrane protein
MRTKKITVSILITLLSAVLLQANQEITKIGVIDITKIYSAYYKDSQAVQELEKLRKQYDDRMEEIKKEITALESKKLDASKANNDQEALRLETEITKKTEYLKDYRRIKLDELKNMEQKLNTSSNFLSELADAIIKVSETEGFTLILKKNDPYIAYYTPETDITDKVIEYLMARKKSE